MVLDPVSLAMSATQIGIGGLQALIGGGKARKAQNQLENMQLPTYSTNKGIKDYYSEALRRYNVSPSNSQQYQYAMQNANRATATGLNALQGRRGAVSGISRLVALQNDAGLKAGAMIEQQKNQQFGQLGNASQMLAGEERMAFQQNKVAPFEKNYNLLALKASGANQVQNAGLQNIFGGFQSAAMIGADSAMNNFGGSNAGTGGSNVPSTYSDYLKMKNYYGRK